MTLLVIDKNKYSYNFMHNGLPKYLSKSFYDFSNEKRYRGIRESLLKEYEIGIAKVADSLKSATHVSENDSSYIITVNDSIKCGEYTLSMLLRFLDYGSRTIKGTLLLLDFIIDTKKKLPLIYKIFKFCGGCSLWE